MNTASNAAGLRRSTAKAAPPDDDETPPPAPKGKKAAAKIKATMGEYKEGALKSGSGAPVTSKAQAVAIALNQARKAK